VGVFHPNGITPSDNGEIPYIAVVLQPPPLGGFHRRMQKMKISLVQTGSDLRPYISSL
jgi:hypothetical protein